VHDLDRDRTRTGARLFHEAYVLLSLTSLFWSGNVVLGRFVAAYIPPIMLSVIRWGGAFFILLPFAARHLVRDWPLIRRHFAFLMLLALTGFSAYNTMAYACRCVRAPASCCRSPASLLSSATAA
jgi:drug/metabolite transporter (DMT)-like permease